MGPLFLVAFSAVLMISNYQAFRNWVTPQPRWNNARYAPPTCPLILFPHGSLLSRSNTGSAQTYVRVKQHLPVLHLICYLIILRKTESFGSPVALPFITVWFSLIYHCSFHLYCCSLLSHAINFQAVITDGVELKVRKGQLTFLILSYHIY